MQQYVVFATLKNASFSLPALLKTYPKIKVLQELDKSAALVEMSADTSRAIAGENPDIVVEPNLRYSLQSAH